MAVKMATRRTDLEIESLALEFRLGHLAPAWEVGNVYYDHQFEGPQHGPCQALVPKYEPDPEKGWLNERAVRVSDQVCGADWTSVLHPPDQFRHWCSILEAGGDCMHFEEEYGY